MLHRYASPVAQAVLLTAVAAALALGAHPAAAQFTPTVDGTIPNGANQGDEYVTAAPQVGSSDGTAPEAERILFYADDANQTLYVGVRGALPTVSDDGIALWLNFQELDGAAAGTDLSVPGASHYMNNSFKADFEVDYTISMTSDRTPSDVRAGVVKHVGTTASQGLGTTNQSGSPITVDFFSSGSDVTWAFDNSGTGNDQGFEIAIPYSALGVSRAGAMEAFAGVVTSGGDFSSETVPGDLGGVDAGTNPDFGALSGGPFHRTKTFTSRFTNNLGFGDGSDGSFTTNNTWEATETDGETIPFEGSKVELGSVQGGNRSAVSFDQDVTLHTLRVNTGTDNNSNDSNVSSTVTVVDSLILETETLADGGGTLELQDGITIRRSNGEIEPFYEPTFLGNASVIYTAGLNTGPEIPSTASKLQLLRIDASGNTVTLTNSVTVNSALELEAGTLSGQSSFLVTLADGSTLRVGTGSTDFTPVVADGTAATVVYTTGGVTTGPELPAGASGNVTLQIDAGGTVTLESNADPTFGGDLTVPNGTLDDNGNTITVQGNATVKSGATHTSTSGGQLTFSGGSSTHTLAGSGTYGTVELNESSTFSGAEATISEGASFASLTATDGALEVQSGGATVSGTVTIDSELQLSGGLDVSGDLTVNGTVTHNGQPITLNGGTAQTLGGTTAPVSLGILALNNGSGATLETDLTIADTLALTTGPLSRNGNEAVTMGDGSTVQVATGTMSFSPTVPGGTAVDVVYTEANVNTGPELPSTANGSVSLKVKDLNGADTEGTMTLESGVNPTLGGDFTVQGHSILDTSGNTITVNGDATITGLSELSGGGTLVFSGGSSTHTLIGEIDFGDVEIDQSDVDGPEVFIEQSDEANNDIFFNALTVTRGALQIDGSADLIVFEPLTVEGEGELILSGELEMRDDLTLNGPLTPDGGEATFIGKDNTLKGSNTPYTFPALSIGSFVPGTVHTLKLEGPVTVEGRLFFDGDSDGDSVSTFDLNGHDVTVKGDLDLLNNNVTADNTTITIDGTGLQKQTLSVGGADDRIDFHNLVVIGKEVEFRGYPHRIENRFTLKQGASVTKAESNTFSPQYSNSSLLRYETGGSPPRGAEWDSTKTSGVLRGHPNDVEVTGGTTLDLSAGGAGTARSIAGALTIGGSSTLDMDNMSAALTVPGALTVDGTLALGTSDGGNAEAQGSSVQVGGTVPANSGRLILNSSSAQTLSGGGTVGALAINNANGVSLGGDLTVGSELRLTSGTLSRPGTETLSLSGGSTVRRSNGELGFAPEFGTPVNVTYTAGLTTGDELSPSNKAGTITVDASGATVTMATGVDPTLNGALTVTSGTLKLNDNDITLEKDLTNNGTLMVGTATVTFAGSTTQTVSGPVGFHDVAVNGGPVDFGGSSSTIGNQLTINAGGALTGTGPAYADGALLSYAAGTAIDRGPEWSSTSGAGYPEDVELTNGTTVDLSAGGAGTARSIAGALTIGGSSTLNMDNMSAALTVNSGATVDGVLTLGSAAGGDLIVPGGNLTINGTLTANGRTVTLNGSSTQTISGTASPISLGGLTLNNGNGAALETDLSIAGTLALTNGTLSRSGSQALTMQDGSTLQVGTGSTGFAPTYEGSASLIYTDGTTTGSELTAMSLNTLEVDAAGETVTMADGANPTVGGALTVTNGTLDLNGNDVTLKGDLTTSGSLSAGSSTLTFAGSGTQTISDGLALNDVTAKSTVDPGSGTTISGTLTLDSGGSLTNNAPTYGGSATLRYATGSNTDRGPEWSSTSGAGYPTDVTLANSTTLDLSAGDATAARSIAGALTIGGSSTLDMADMSAALTVPGALTVDGTLALGSAAGGNAEAQGSTVQVGGTVPANSGRLILNGSSAQTLSGGGTVGALAINNANGVSLGGDLTVGSELRLTSGTLSRSANEILSLSGGSTVRRSDGALGFAPSFGTPVNVTYTAGLTTGDELSSSNAGTLTVDAPGATVTMGTSTDPTLQGDLTIQNGTFNDNGNTITVTGGATVSGTGHTWNGTLVFSGGSSTHTLAGSGTYGTVELNESSTFSNAPEATISEGASFASLTATDGALEVQAGGATVSGAVTVDSDLQLSGGLDVGGDLTVNGTISASGQTIITLNGSSTQTLGGTTSPLSLGSLTLNNGNDATLETDLSIAGTLALTSGTLFRSGSQTLTMQDGSTLQVGTGSTGFAPTYEGSASLIYTAGTTTGDELTAMSLNTLEVDASGETVTMADGANPTVGGDLTVTNGTLDLNDNIVTLEGDLTNNGTLTVGTAAVTFAGSTTQTVSGPVGFRNVAVNGGPVDFGGSSSTIGNRLTLNTGGALTGTGPDYADGALLRYAAGTAIDRGPEWSSTSGAGYPEDVELNSGTTLDLSAGGAATARSIAGALTIGGNSTLDMANMSAALTVGNGATVYGTLTLGSAAGGNLIVPGGNLTINGALTANGRTVTLSGSGSSAQTLGGTVSSLSLGGLTLDNSSGATLGTDLSIAGTLALTNGTLSRSGDQSLTMQDGSTLQVGTGSTGFEPTYNGSASLVYTAGTTTGSELTSPSLNTLEVDAPNATVTMDADFRITIDGDLIVTNGTLDLNGNDVDLKGDLTESGTLVDNVTGGGTVRFRGSGTQNVTGTPTFDDVQLNTTVDFASSPTVKHSLILNPGGSIATSAPNYGDLAQLVYETEETTDRGLEWSSTSGAGHPNDVIIRRSGTTLDLSAGDPTTPRSIAGELDIRRNSALDMDDMAAPLTVGTKVNVSGTLTLGSNPGGDLIVSADTQGATGLFVYDGTLNANGRTVTLNGSEDQDIGGTSALTFGGLTIDNANGVTLSTQATVSKVLTLTSGTFDVTGGSLTLASTPSRTAAVAGSGSGTVNGDVTMERHVRFPDDGSNNSHWRFLSSPLSVMLDDAGSNGNSDNLLSNVWTQSTGSGANAQVNVGNATIFTYAEDTNINNNLSEGWADVADLNDGPITPGDGYLTFLFENNNSAGPDGFPVTLSVTGSLPADETDGTDAAPALTFTDDDDPDSQNGWNLVANPFAAPLDWESVVDNGLEQLDKTIYVWDPRMSQYATYTADGGGTGGAGTQNRFIAPFQAFFVKAGPNPVEPPDPPDKQSSLQPAMTITADDKEVQATPSLKSTPPDSSAPRVTLRLRAASDSTGETTVVRYTDEADAGKDPLDAYQLKPFRADYALLASGMDGRDALFDLQSRPVPTVRDTLDLALDVTASGTYTLDAAALEGLPAGWKVILEHKETGARHDLGAGASVTFDYAAPESNGAESSQARPAAATPTVATTSDSSDALPNFRLYVGPQAALPVELASFDAATDAGAVSLTWRTASETNNAGFTVERRAGNAGSWIEVGTREGAGTTTQPQTYRFRDTEVPFAAETLTYRLQQADLDGTTTLSDTLAVSLAAPETTTLRPPFPNPVRQQATIRYTMPRAQDVTIALYDVLGRRVRTLVQDQKAAGRFEQTVDLSALSSGAYFLRLHSGNTTQTRRLTVIR